VSPAHSFGKIPEDPAVAKWNIALFTRQKVRRRQLQCDANNLAVIQRDSGFAKAREVSQKNRQCRDCKRCVQARRERWQRGVYEGGVRGQVSIISGGLEAGCGSPFHATGGEGSARDPKLG
jgi:hypothetical protein